MSLRRIACCLSALLMIIALIIQPVARAASTDSVPAGECAELKFDPAQTAIAFTLTGWPHDTHGTFKLKEGAVRVDPASGKMNGAIVVDAASGVTGNSLRDARMRNSILGVGRYPDITFTPQQVVSHGAPQGEFPVVVRGTMTLRGLPHPFTITAEVERHGQAVTVHCTLVIPYVAWGLEDPSVLFFTVAKQVDVHVTAVAHLSWVAP